MSTLPFVPKGQGKKTGAEARDELLGARGQAALACLLVGGVLRRVEVRVAERRDTGAGPEAPEVLGEARLRALRFGWDAGRGLGAQKTGPSCGAPGRCGGCACGGCTEGLPCGRALRP